MELREYRVGIGLLKRLPRVERLKLYSRLRSVTRGGPLSPFEAAFAARIAATVPQPATWYHGGLVGRAAGELLLPPSATGADPRGAVSRLPDNAGHVYVTWHPATAQHVVRMNERAGKPSTVYTVEPQGELTPDPEGIRFAILVCLDAEQWEGTREATERALWLTSLSCFRCEAAKVEGVLGGNAGVVGSAAVIDGLRQATSCDLTPPGQPATPLTHSPR
jgi:hypothetical protein